MSEQKFFRCKHCGNFLGLINNAGIPLVCCGEVMEELIPNTVECATEKHLPSVEVRERLVYAQIGSEIHPSLEEHHIDFIYLQTENGGQRRSIKVGETPKAMFCVTDDTPIAVFAYCNIHGLWETVIEK